MATPNNNNNNPNIINNNNIATAKPGTLGVGVGAVPTPPKSQRGHNKPKCKQCGNVARSRCPYECCKSCCSRNQNPCHIHVLKANSTFPDKAPSSGASPLDQQSLDPPQSTSAGRVASLRQLSNSFAQFNNLHLSLRSKKPLTRKDAAAINEWRFAKIKEYKERNVEVENEAFDRYMQNVDLLEEVLAVKSLDENVPSALESNPTTMESNEAMIPGLKLQLRSNSMRSDGLRMRIQQIVDEGLKKLKKSAVDGDINESIDDESNKASERGKGIERLSAISDLMEKINKARTEEDLKPCLEMKTQLFNLDEGASVKDLQDNEMHENETVVTDVVPAEGLDYSLPKFVTTTEIDLETLNTIDKHFSTQDIEQL
ncbi:hypothetical protein GLYMA_17G150800v4 [Glycine max]|uniref:Uncharacterized protein n=1 Tax=Glycine max TaxID=3847 RepID=A0A0R0FDP9_SOYBN|nr:uncharacterized protein LOC100816049 isoform X1 [Glycine max]XP_028208686.1 uncharacterized protein LOC114391887 isoform X1 [Glycine soja]KAG4930494.1 hypothetical protein JHK86_047455 [Glycine max]KAG4933262.1 hypothetical protein JHK87_047264 [Glycine soja]KAG5102509.1 hypothetical protein JHK84_047478 [Glycine max]KAH1202332.1 hypothetical protein GmHk_17G048824 [Glycine max]KRH04273.1 hypothetical protein GLYMA_17G150800v4 [Glycine max]|eukprot:XP_006600880.1 uncharacterized protein LOC100816049 isoform X1 [Glycine max]